MKQLLLFACLSMFSFGLSAQVFVDADATGAGDGSSWADAYTDLAIALAAANEGDEVWVADGRYVTPSDTSFVINKGISLLGGFNGTETSADAADPAANVTILSGDVAGNDVAGTFDSLTRVDNQRVIFVADSSSMANQLGAVINGFTIRDGNRDGFVGGVLDPWAGGGIFATGQVTISNVIFEDNFSEFGSDVAIVGPNADNTVLDNVTILNSHPGPRWAVYNRLTDGVVIRNANMGYPRETAPTPQGMVFSLDVLNFTVEDCAFSDINTTGFGGAVHVEGVAGTATVRNVTIDNCASDLGGGLYLRNFDIYEDADGEFFTGTTTVENVTMTNIQSQRWGGAVLFSQVNSVVKGVTISDVDALQAGGLGGGLYFQSNADPGVLPLRANWTDIDIDGVTSGSLGGGVFMFINPDYEVSLDGVAINDVSSSDSGGGLFLVGGGPALGAENITRLSNLSVTNCSTVSAPNPEGGFFLSTGGGLTSFSQDLIINGVTMTGNSTGSEASRGGGLSFAGNNQTLELTGGVFRSNRSHSGSGLTVSGLSQTVTIRNSEFSENGNTLINPGNAYRGGGLFLIYGNDADILLDSVEISSNVVDREEGVVSGGAGIYLVDIVNGGETPQISITNSLLSSNVAGGNTEGGGIYIQDDGNITFDNTDFTFNTSGGEGGAIFARKFTYTNTVNGVPQVILPEVSISVSNALVQGNSSGTQGGAVSTQRATADFTNVVFADNTAAEGGGGAIIFNGTSPIVQNGELVEDTPTSVLTAEVVNCTFLNNAAGAGAAGTDIALFQAQNNFTDTIVSLSLTLQNSAFFNGVPDLFSIELEPASDVIGEEYGDVSVTSLGGNFFNLENGPGADGNPLVDNPADIFIENIGVETLFEDPNDNEDRGFPLVRPAVTDPLSNNPLIDAGTTGPLVPATGIDGNPRGETPDIGAYELDWDVTNVQTVTDSGLDMDFFPNPTVDVVNIRSNDASITAYTLLLSDANGRVLRSHRFNGAVNTLSLTDVPSGIYTLQLVVDGNVYTQQVVKQ